MTAGREVSNSSFDGADSASALINVNACVGVGNSHGISGSGHCFSPYCSEGIRSLSINCCSTWSNLHTMGAKLWVCSLWQESLMESSGISRIFAAKAKIRTASRRHACKQTLSRLEVQRNCATYSQILLYSFLLPQLVLVSGINTVEAGPSVT